MLLLTKHVRKSASTQYRHQLLIGALLHEILQVKLINSSKENRPLTRLHSCPINCLSQRKSILKLYCSTITKHLSYRSGHGILIVSFHKHYRLLVSLHMNIIHSYTV